MEYSIIPYILENKDVGMEEVRYRCTPDEVK